jgi:hypothetical protein
LENDAPLDKLSVVTLKVRCGTLHGPIAGSPCSDVGDLADIDA